MCVSVYIGRNERLLVAVCKYKLCVSVCVYVCVLCRSSGPLLYSLCAKGQGIAEIESNLKDIALEQALLQMDLLR